MIVDCDSHFLPRDAFEHIEGSLAARRPVITWNADGMLAGVEFAGVPPQVPGSSPIKSGFGTGSQSPGLWDMEFRLDEYRRMGIDAQVILPQFAGWWNYLLDAELAVALAHSYNVAMLRQMRAHPKTVHAVANVAAQDPANSVRELEWAARNGFCGVVLDHTFPVAEHPFGVPTPCRRELWPLFKRAAELNMPVHFHPVQSGHRLRNLLHLQCDGIADFFLPPLIDHHLTVVACITSGLLDAYPDLRIVQSEMFTGFIPELARRMDRVHEESEALARGEVPNAAAAARVRGRGGNHLLLPEPEAAAKNRQPPSHYFRKNFYWTIETEETELADAVEFLGADRFLFATDYPHDDPGGAMRYQDLELLSANTRLSAEDKRRIGGENAIELFGLRA